jgi:hypothetical protein
MEKSRLLLGLCVTVISIVFTTTAHAAVIYSYNGNNFNTILNSAAIDFEYSGSQSISIEFTVPSLLIDLFNTVITPDTFTISDGVTTFTESDSIDGRSFSLFTDSSGDITDWAISATEKAVTSTWTVGDEATSMLSVGRVLYYSPYDKSKLYRCASVNPDSSCASIYLAFGSNSSIPGLWTTTTVPIPAAAWLFGSGLLCLVGIARRKKAA